MSVFEVFSLELSGILPSRVYFCERFPTETTGCKKYLSRKGAKTQIRL